MANPIISINDNVNPSRWGYTSRNDLHQEAIDISLAIEKTTSLTRKSKPENMLVNIVEFPNQSGSISLWYHINWIGSHQTPRMIRSKANNINSYASYTRIRSHFQKHTLNEIIV